MSRDGQDTDPAQTPASGPAAGSVLLTGATGFVGMELLARWLERDRRPVIALIRARDDESAARRLRDTLECVFGDPDAHAERVTAIAYDLTSPSLGLGDRAGELCRQVGEIVHCAASVAFDLGEDEAREINVDGTRRMLELAGGCAARGGLRRFTYISTAYVAGEHEGTFHEGDLDVGQSFRNSYERSKFQAESMVREHASALPVTVARPSIVVGDRRTGWTSAFNVLYWPLRAFERGAYSVLPARRDSPVDVVSVDFVADAVFELAGHPEAEGGTYNLTAGRLAPTVGDLIGLASRSLGAKPPRVVSPESFARMQSVIMSEQDARSRRLLEASETYFPYFAVRVHYDTSRADALLGPAGIAPAPLAGYFDRLLDFARRADWGRRAIGRAEALAAVNGGGRAHEPSGRAAQ